MSDSLDATYYAPAFDVKIDGQDLEAEALKSISGISVTKGIDKADIFSFTVQDELNEGQFKWLGSDQFKYGKKVNINLGYVDNKTLTIQAHIDEITPSFFTGAVPTIDIKGVDKAFAKLKEEIDAKVYKNKKHSDIVSEIAGEVGLTPQVDQTSGEAEEERQKDVGKSYLDFIRMLLKENPGFEFFVADGKLYFRESQANTTAIMTLKWGQHLLNFKPILNVADMATKVTVKCWSEKEKKVYTGEAAAGSETKEGSGQKTGSQIANEIFGTKEKVIIKKVASDSEAQTEAKAELERSSANFITGEGEVVGIPDLKPGVCIEIQGVGDWFSGTYYVTETTHKIDTNGYRTTFKIARNSL